MKKLRIAFISLILAVCIVPSALLLCGFKNANRENRPLAQMPKLFGESGINLGFAEGFDKFMDDNFALREYLVTAGNTASAALTGDYNGDSAVIGKNGALYYAETLDDYLGMDQLDNDKIAVIADYLAALQNELRANGVEMLFIIAPNKATIYPEEMPDYLAPTDTPRNIDLLQTALSEKGVSFIDAKALLLSAKQARRVYYLRDSHWNNYGATLVYNACASQLGLQTYDPEAYAVVKDYSGDLVNFVYPSARHYEERIVYTYTRTAEPVDHQVNFDMFKTNITVSDANDTCLLIYHDSFGKSLQPIFAVSCGRLIMQKSNSPVYSAEYVYSQGADAVIIELVERNLDLLYEYALSVTAK